MPPPLRPGLPLTPIVTRPILAPLSPRPLAPAARVEALVAELRRLRSETNRCVHRSGVILRELAQPASLAAAGVTDFDALLAHYDLPARMSAMKYIAVAEHFTEDEAAQLGVERGYAIVRGAAAMPQPIAPRALLAKNPMIGLGPASVRLAAAPLRTVLGWVGSLEGTASPAPSKRQYKDADSARDKLCLLYTSPSPRD